MKGLPSFTDTGLVYLDDVKNQIQSASEDSKIKKVEKRDKEIEGGIITQLVVKYKGNLPTIPNNLREKLVIDSGDG